MRDLTDPRYMYLKAVLFIVAGTLSVAGIVVSHPTLETAGLLAVAIWSFCRAYYFAFYVIEKYIDPSFRFAGLTSVVAHLLRTRSKTR